jgi:hypothetical protein
MSIYNTLEWGNESAFTSYPFDFDIEVQGFLVDANFVQFDNFKPVLNYITVDTDRINLNFTFDYGQQSIDLLKSVFMRGEEYRQLRIYSTEDARYLGTLVFGEGVFELWNNYIGRKINIATSFMSAVVRSVPSDGGVYTLDGNYGNVVLGRTSSDRTIFYNISTALNCVTFNAVTGHAVSETENGTAKPEGLRKINLVPPLNNNINLAANDVIKITTLNNASLTIELVTGTPSQSFNIPSLNV